MLVTNDSNAPVVQIAREDSIPNVIIEGVYRRKFASKHDKEKARNEFDERAVGILKEHQIDLVALAGFMQVLGPRIVEAYRFRIMNIHPAKIW